MPFLEHGDTKPYHKCDTPDVFQGSVASHVGPYTQNNGIRITLGAGARWQCPECKTTFKLNPHSAVRGYWEWKAEGVDEDAVPIGDPGPSTFGNPKRKRWFHK